MRHTSDCLFLSGRVGGAHETGWAATAPTRLLWIPSRLRPQRIRTVCHLLNVLFRSSSRPSFIFVVESVYHLVSICGWAWFPWRWIRSNMLVRIKEKTSNLSHYFQFSWLAECFSGYDQRRYDSYDYDDEHDTEKGDGGERDGKVPHENERPMSASPHDYDHRQAPFQKDTSDEMGDLDRPATSREDMRKEMEAKREDGRYTISLSSHKVRINSREYGDLDIPWFYCCNIPPEKCHGTLIIEYWSSAVKRMRCPHLVSLHR